MFAVSTASVDSTAIFNNFKNTLKNIIEKYGTGKVRYAIIPFGTQATTAVAFTKDPPSQDLLKQQIDTMVPSVGDPDVKKALEEAKNLFGIAPERPKAKKVLVILTDKKSVNVLSALKMAAKPLEENKIKIVPVAIGNEASKKELLSLTTNEGYLVKSSSEDRPNHLAQKIMEKVIMGKLFEVNISALQDFFLLGNIFK